MAAIQPPGDIPPYQGIRRSVTMPVRQPPLHERATFDTSDAAAEILYEHDTARVINFEAPKSATKPTSDLPQDTDYPVDTIETLPWRSRTEALLASGRMRIEKVPGSVYFLKCQSVTHPILRNTQCWCVDGESKFVLRIRAFTYYRIELPSDSDEDKAKVEELKSVLPMVLRYERTPCPFIRAFHVDLPEDAITPRRKGQWQRRDSSQPATPETESPSIRVPKSDRTWSMRAPPSAYPRNGPGQHVYNQTERPGSSSGLSARAYLLNDSRPDSPRSDKTSDDEVLEQDEDLKEDFRGHDETELDGMRGRTHNRDTQPERSISVSARIAAIERSRTRAEAMTSDEIPPLPSMPAVQHTKIMPDQNDEAPTAEQPYETGEKVTMSSPDTSEQSQASHEEKQIGVTRDGLPSNLNDSPTLQKHQAVESNGSDDNRNHDTTQEDVNNDSRSESNLDNAQVVSHSHNQANHVSEMHVDDEDEAEGVDIHDTSSNGSNEAKAGSENLTLITSQIEPVADSGDLTPDEVHVEETLTPIASSTAAVLPDNQSVTQLGSEEVLETSVGTSVEQEDDIVSTISSTDSFHTLTSDPARGHDEDGMRTERGKEISTSSIPVHQHKRGISDMTITIPETSGPFEGHDNQSAQMAELERTASVQSSISPPLQSPGAWPSPELNGIRQRLRARRSFSPLPPSANLLNNPTRQSSADAHHFAKAVLQKAVVVPLEAVVLVLHVLARIANGATVNDLVSGELFKRPERTRRVSGLPDQDIDNRRRRASEDDGVSIGDGVEEDDFGLPLRGRPRRDSTGDYAISRRPVSPANEDDTQSFISID